MPIDQLNALYSALAAPTAELKGKILEELCSTFFGALPGVEVVDRRVLDEAKSQEVDLVLDNYQDPDGLPDMDQILFVESKNWADPVGSAEVAWFDWKIRLSGYQQGFLVVANGVTGRADDKTSAWNILWQANMEGRRLIVLTPAEMAECTDAQAVRKLIRRKRRLLAAKQAPL
jgi:hypothetical protein